MRTKNAGSASVRCGIALALVSVGICSPAFAAQWSADSYTLATGDFNDDGKADLLVIAKDPSKPSGIALADSNGQPNIFHQSWASSYLGITWHSGTYIPHVGDFDGDHRDDIFLQRVSNGSHYILRADAAGKFTSIHQTIPNSGFGSSSLADRRIIVGDFNNDGRDDLFLQASAASGDNAIALAGSDGSLSAITHSWPNAYLNLEWSVPRAVAHAGDFDGDYRADLLVQAKPNWAMIPLDDLVIPVPTYRGESYGIVLSDGTGKATTVVDTWNHDHLGLEWSPLHYNIYVDNFDGLCGADVLLQAKRAGGASYIVLTSCSGTLPSGSTVHTLAAGYLGVSSWDAGSYQFVTGDFNNDGRADIYMQALAAGSPNRIAFVASGGNVTSAPPSHTPSGDFKKPVPGAIPGEFAVGGQGDASYTIPIVAPAGTGGLMPNLALTYNHSAGNGLAGMRWNLAGISAITRCQATVAQDGSVVPINYTSTDRFCLDGRRLVSVEGTYGADGAKYHTEVETFQRITQSGVQGVGLAGPASFRVDHGNGLHSLYGTSADSQIEVTGGSGAVRIWYIARTEDQFGNRITYSYSENSSTGEAFPTEITWTSNSAQGLAAKYKVVITPQNRDPDDQRSGYDAAGTLWTSTKRIDKIDVLEIDDGTQLINSYDLEYASSPVAGTGRGQLKQVLVCGETECLPPTQFAVQNGTRGWGALTNTTRSVGTSPLIGDVNGDGKKDLFAGSSSTWHAYFGTASGSFEAAVNSTVSIGPEPLSARIIDYDSDGKADLLYKSSTVWRVLRYNGTSFVDSPTTISTANPTHARILDFDGDGLRDWLYTDASSNDLKWMRNTGASFATAQTLTAPPGALQGYEHPEWGPDFNGDGRDDLINLDEYCEPQPFPPYEYCVPGWGISIAAGGGYTGLLGLWAWPPDEIGSPVPVDINGDGLDDIAYVQGSYWHTQLSTGNGFGTAVATGIPGYGPALVSDYDHDGRQDLIIPDGSAYRVYGSNGSTFPYSSNADSLAGGTVAAVSVADVSGDGFDDIVRVSSGTVYVNKHSTAFPDVVTSFTNGLGHSIGVQYESLANTSHYTVNHSQTLPTPYTWFLARTRFARTHYVVTAENHDDGIGGTRPFTHDYYQAVMDVSGRRWRSFLRHRVNDVDRGTYAQTEFYLGWPTVGMARIQELRRTSDNLLIKTTEHTLLDTTTVGGARFVRPQSAVTVEYEVGGPQDGTHLRTVSETRVHDESSGALLGLETTVTGDIAEVWTSTTGFERTNETGLWCLGLPGLVTTTKTAPGEQPAVRKVRHTFNTSNCTLSEVKDESETDLAKRLKTTYTYDGYGNVDVVSTDSVDATAQNRSTDFQYDEDGQFPASITIGTVNLTTAFQWNYLHGARSQVTAPDGLTTEWFYDDFGRLKKEERPVGHTEITYDDCYTCPVAFGRFFSRSHGSDGSDSTTFFDELQRTVGTSAAAPLGNETRRQVRYDGLGQIEYLSQPYIYFDPVYWVEYEHDLMGRLIEEDAPVSESEPSGAITEYEYRGREVWVEDAEDHITKYVHNAAGQIQQVIDAMGGTTAYTYYPFGELKSVTDPESNQTTIEYDPRGYKKALIDPNMGTWLYEHNAYGELARQKSPITSTNACSGVPGVWTVCLAYDQAGRLDSRTEAEGLTDFTYHASGTGQKGQLNEITGPGHGLKYTYSPDHGLPTQIRHTLDGVNHFYDLSYDPQARLDVLTYPESTSSYRFKVDYDYDAFGHLAAAKDGNTPSTVFYTLNEADALGREVLVRLGNGLDEYHEFDLASGNLKKIETGPSLGTSIQNLSVTYDEAGNVLTRTNANIGKTETFTYDALDRLKTTQVSGLSLLTNDYSAAGRVTSRTDVGSYAYTGGSCGGGPNAVKSAAGKTYCYDAAGRMTMRGSGNDIAWTTFDLPTLIKNGTQSAHLSYGVDRARYKQIQKTGSAVDATILYIGNLLERETAGSTDTWRHYVSVRGRTVAKVDRVNTTNTTQYLHRDQQASVVEVTSTSGALVQSLAYDAWGLRRNASNWAPLPNPFGGTPQIKRGYTGHEHLDTVELVHMNGRVQDPRLGLFISADPFVQAPYHSPSLNRYSYVWNNPTTLVDPSGFEVCSAIIGWVVPEGNPDGAPRFQGIGDALRFCGVDTGEQSTGSPFVFADATYRDYSGNGGMPQGGVRNGGVVITGQRPASGNETTTYTFGGTEWRVDSQQIATAVDYIRTHIPLQAAQRDGSWKEHYGRLYYSSGPPVDGIPMPGNPDGMCYGGSIAECRRADRNPTRANSRALEANAEAAAQGRRSKTMNVHLHPGTDADSLRFSDADISLAVGTTGIPVFIGNMNGDMAVLLPGMRPSRGGDGLVLCKGCAK